MFGVVVPGQRARQLPCHGIDRMTYRYPRLADRQMRTRPPSSGKKALAFKPGLLVLNFQSSDAVGHGESQGGR